MQIFNEAQAEGFSFDVLDATKIVPEELVPVTPVGRLCSPATPTISSPRRSKSRSTRRTSCTALTPATTRCSPARPLVRRHSAHPARRAELPIDPDQCARRGGAQQPGDGFHCQAVNRGRVSYEPTSLGGGRPFQAGMRGFTSFRNRPRAASRRSLPSTNVAELAPPERLEKPLHGCLSVSFSGRIVSGSGGAGIPAISIAPRVACCEGGRRETFQAARRSGEGDACLRSKNYAGEVTFSEYRGRLTLQSPHCGG